MKDIQTLLDEEAKLDINDPTKAKIHKKLKKLRGSEPPPCHGEDDCSSFILFRCPWRIDCG